MSQSMWSLLHYLLDFQLFSIYIHHNVFCDNKQGRIGDAFRASIYCIYILSFSQMSEH